MLARAALAGATRRRGFSSLPSSNSYVHNFMYTVCVCGGGGGGGCEWMAVKLVLRLTFIKHSVS